jgi:hypothetical protein
MTFARSVALAVILCCAAVSPAAAKSKPRAKSASGVFCEQGSEHIYLPIKSFKPSQRKNMRVGMKARVNIAGVGPINCRVY